MEHRAYVFDSMLFDQELRPILEMALLSGDDRDLISFVEGNRAVLVAPYEGQALEGEWRDLLEIRDAHQYGDFALTKYYNPIADIGLGHGWSKLQVLIEERHASRQSPILGSVVGPLTNPFDPGKLGAYFQTPETVRESLSALTGLSAVHGETASLLSQGVQMLEKARVSDKGLYITF